MTDTVALWLGERLLIGSLQGAVIIALVWLVCRLVPRIPAAAQAALWWLAALKLVLVFTPMPTLLVPFLPATVSAEAILAGTPEGSSYGTLSGGTAQAVLNGDALNTREPIAATSRARLIVLLWFAAVLIQAGRLILAHRVLRVVVHRSTIWPGTETRELAEQLGLSRVPQVRLSDEIDTPQVCGLRNPVVLVPAETMAGFTVEERRMTLCHELMHIRRRDLVVGWIPACAERLFFFHPLARLAAHEYLDAREAACDAAAVRALDVPAGDYGHMLVRLGIGRAGPALAAGGSPFSASSLKRRLRMLEHQDAPVSRRWRMAVALIATLVIPIQLVARTPADPAQPDWKQDDRIIVFTGERANEVTAARVELQNTSAQVEQRKAEQAIERAKADQQKAQEQAERTRAARLKAQEASAEQARRLRERTQQLRQQRDEGNATGLDQQAENHQRILELMALARENAVRNEMHHLEKQLSGRVALLEQMRKRHLTGQQHEILARQYRELAEYYERLAAEQRKLAEEIEQAQREAVPAK